MMMKNFTLPCIGVMLILSIPAQAQDSLFISEVTDPADDYSGRFIELFNPGAEAVDFSAVTIFLSRQSNGGTGWGDLQLTGTIAAGETFVLGGSGFEEVYGFAPDQETGIIIGNGNDAYFLYRDGDHTVGTLHDIFGALDTDGVGEPWEYEDSRAVRVEGIMAPNIVWETSEWEITSANVSDCDPGTYFGSGLSVNNISLSIINDTVIEGLPFEVHISVNEDISAFDIISCQFDIDYDSTILEYTGNDITGTIAGGGSLAVNTSIPGKLSISYMNSTPLAGSGDILKLQFKSLDADTTRISISRAYINSTPLHNLTNGTVIIMNAMPPAAVITYNDTMNRYADTLIITATFSEIMDEANAVKLSLSGATTLVNADMMRQNETMYSYSYQIPKAEGDVTVRLSNGTDMWGNEVIPVPTGGDTFYILKFFPGDVDDDGTILAYDAALVLQYSVELDPLPGMDPLPWEPWRDSTANVDGTGGITANDAGMILQYSAGIIAGFPGEEKKSGSFADVTVAVTDNDIIFVSHGELLGLNLSATSENEMLGFPVILDENFMSAFNNEGGAYNVGLCTAYSPADGTAIMKIPLKKRGSVTFRMLINTEERIITLNQATGLNESENREISIYPNPAREQIFINTGKYCSKDACRLKVLNPLGSTIYETTIEEPSCEIDLSDWPGRGMYYFQVTDKRGTRIATRKIIIQSAD